MSQCFEREFNDFLDKQYPYKTQLVSFKLSPLIFLRYILAATYRCLIFLRYILAATCSCLTLSQFLGYECRNHSLTYLLQYIYIYIKFVPAFRGTRGLIYQLLDGYLRTGLALGRCFRTEYLTHRPTTLTYSHTIANCVDYTSLLLIKLDKLLV